MEDLGIGTVVAADTWVGRDKGKCSEAYRWALVCELLKLTAEPSQIPDTD